MNGDTETGVTTFFLKHEIDTGDVIAREKIEIAPSKKRLLMPLSEHALTGIAVKPQPTCKICGRHRFFTGRLHDGKRYA